MNASCNGQKRAHSSVPSISARNLQRLVLRLLSAWFAREREFENADDISDLYTRGLLETDREALQMDLLSEDGRVLVDAAEEHVKNYSPYASPADAGTDIAGVLDSLIICYRYEHGEGDVVDHDHMQNMERTGWLAWDGSEQRVTLSANTWARAQRILREQEHIHFEVPEPMQVAF